MVNYLHKLFNIIFEKGYIPSKWAKVYIVPLNTKRNVNQVEKNRGMTLLNTFGQLFFSNFKQSVNIVGRRVSYLCRSAGRISKKYGHH